MVTSAQVIIHFVGLCLFSNQVPNDCGQKVILPQVVYRDPMGTATQFAPGLHIGEPVSIPVNPLGPHRHVEDHIALLVFKRASYVTSVNWAAPTPLPGDPSYAYVKLDGDRIRIETGLPDQPLTADLKLPPLKTLCPSMGTLGANFQPPYFGAAAVVDLPQGELKSCDAGLRVDTEVKLNVNGTFVVQASTMRARKEIRLRGSGVVELFVANVPVSCLSPTGCKAADPASMAGVSHVYAYYEMGTQSASCGASIQGWYQTAPASAKPATACTMNVPAAAGGIGMSEVGKVSATNFECSNSKWP